MSRNKIATKATREDLSGVDITFSDGVVIGASLDEFSPEIVQQLALHGLSQKLGDSYSGETDLTVARGKVEGVKSRLASGDWRAVREGTGGGRITDLAQALANVTGRTLEEAVTVIDQMDKGQKAKLRKHDRIKVELLSIQKARAEKAVTGDDGIDLAAVFG